MPEVLYGEENATNVVPMLAHQIAAGTYTFPEELRALLDSTDEEYQRLDTDESLLDKYKIHRAAHFAVVGHFLNQHDSMNLPLPHSRIQSFISNLESEFEDAIEVWQYIDLCILARTTWCQEGLTYAYQKYLEVYPEAYYRTLEIRDFGLKHGLGSVSRSDDIEGFTAQGLGTARKAYSIAANGVHSLFPGLTAEEFSQAFVLTYSHIVSTFAKGNLSRISPIIDDVWLTKSPGLNLNVLKIQEYELDGKKHRWLEFDLDAISKLDYETIIEVPGGITRTRRTYAERGNYMVTTGCPFRVFGTIHQIMERIVEDLTTHVIK